ncbi:hypothetical protein ACKFKG_31005 [Phormidesmis sp. 146-35]
MKQEVIWDFLNLPGIAGIALMDGRPFASNLKQPPAGNSQRSQSFFYGNDQAINFQQKEALSQGILQVVETIPDGFESFELKFLEYQAYIYKLQSGRVLLVLARRDLDFLAYSRAIVPLQASIESDFEGTISVLHAIAATQNSLAIDRRVTHSPLAAGVETAVTEQTIITLRDLLAAFNHLNTFTTQFLGTAVIVNYLKTTRPDSEWLSKFQIDRAAHMTFVGEVTDAVTDQQHQWIRDWVAAFIRRCSQVVRNFGAIVEQNAFDAQQKLLLLN